MTTVGVEPTHFELKPSFVAMFMTTCRVKVLDYLLRVGEDSISRIATEIGNNHSNVTKVVDFFINSGMLSEKHFGRIRVIHLNAKHPTVKALRAFYTQVEG